LIHIIDIGLGNIQALVTMYKRLGIATTRVKSVDDFQKVQKLILPGVGAFDHAMDLLNSSGLSQTLEKLVRQEKIPVMGICVGMQILATSSEEGCRQGLSWVGGRVKSFADNPSSANLPKPHMGWNDVVPSGSSPLFKGLEEGARFYFLHSYYFECLNQINVAANTEYGHKFACAVQNDNAYGVQFHPEKSHHWGATLLKNFAEL
jgi:glutamine amidotransferase